MKRRIPSARLGASRGSRKMSNSSNTTEIQPLNPQNLSVQPQNLQLPSSEIPQLPNPQLPQSSQAQLPQPPQVQLPQSPSVSQIIHPILPPVQNTHPINTGTTSEPYIIPSGPSVMPIQSYNTSTLTMGAVSILTNIGTINTFRELPNEDIRKWLTQFNWIADIN